MIDKKTIDSYMEEQETKPCKFCGLPTKLRVLLPLRIIGEVATYPRCEECSGHLEQEFQRIKDMSDEKAGAA